jgi:uncharacterized protein YjbJ (UPF0337 family)
MGTSQSTFATGWNSDLEKLMSERIDELKGDIEQSVGKMRNDAPMEARGEEDAAVAREKRKIEGVIAQTAGEVVEYVGGKTLDPLAVADGEALRDAGAVEQKG